MCSLQKYFHHRNWIRKYFSGLRLALRSPHYTTFELQFWLHIINFYGRISFLSRKISWGDTTFIFSPALFHIVFNGAYLLSCHYFQRIESLTQGESSCSEDSPRLAKHKSDILLPTNGFVGYFVLSHAVMRALVCLSLTDIEVLR